jgi:porin
MQKRYGLYLCCTVVIAMVLALRVEAEILALEPFFSPSRSYLLGDQGATSGSEPNGMEYGGRLDLLLNLDAEKLVGWRGGAIVTHTEYRYGEQSNSQAGTLLPTNVLTATPGMTNRPALTSLYVSQKIGASRLNIGKMSAVDIIKDAPMLGRRGFDGFSHMQLTAPISGIVPPVFMGARALIPVKGMAWAIWVFDPNDKTDTYSFDRLFADGVNIRVTAGWPATFTRYKGGLQGITAAYSTAEGTDYSEIGQPGQKPGTKRGAYCVSYQIEQFVSLTWGVFGKFSIADGNPNYHQNSFQLGVSGTKLIASRPQDRFGLGYFHVNFSDALREALSPLVKLGPEYGVEAFYCYEVVPGFGITANIQWVRPVREDEDDAVFMVLRAVVRF